MIRVIIAGQFRGNQHTWNSLSNMFVNMSEPITVYAGSPNVWVGFDIPHEFIQTSVIPNTIFEESQHDHKFRYIEQWSALYTTFKHFESQFSEQDTIVKMRNDIFVSNAFEGTVEENAIYVPEKEFHESTPFDINTVCNDQIVMGKLEAMRKYFDLPYKFIWEPPMDKSIEQILRLYLRQQQLEMKTFSLSYHRP